MHVFENANRCDLAEVEEVAPSPEHPDGLKWKAPCRCPRFLTLVHDVQEPGPPDANGKPTFVTVRTQVVGCFYRLFPWMQGGAITQMNATLAETIAGRKDTQEMRDSIVRELRESGERTALQVNLLAQATILMEKPGEMKVIGEAVPAQLPGTADAALLG